MKSLIFSAVALIAISFGSCRKAYTCECSTSNGGSTAIVNEKELSKQSLKDARSECDKGDTKIGSLATECEIKL
jgi:hypothetical protein